MHDGRMEGEHSANMPGVTAAPVKEHTRFGTLLIEKRQALATRLSISIGLIKAAGSSSDVTPPLV